MDKRQAFESMAAGIDAGKLTFPTSARVALRVRDALDDPDCRVDVAAQLVQAEPVLAARVVAMANSVAFNRSGREIPHVRTAVARLGFGTVRALATALIARQLAEASALKSYQPMAAQLWAHTAHVASLAQVIARRVTGQDPEAALFAGIVHEIGGFYLISRAKDFPGLLDGDPTEWLDSGEPLIGRAVLKLLAVPAQVMAAIEGYWDGFLAMPPTTLADTLLLAEELAPVPSPLRQFDGQTGEPGMTAHIEMAIGEEALSDILRESAEEVSSLAGALNF